MLPDGYRVPTRPDITRWLGWSMEDQLYPAQLHVEGVHFVERVRNQLRADGLQPRTQWSRFEGHYNAHGPIVICPVSSMVSKDWLPSRWAHFTARLETSGYEIQAQTQGSLDALEAQLRQARLVVGVDTGPLHLADYMGIPVVGLYGVTRPERHGPLGPHARVWFGRGSLQRLTAEELTETVLAHLLHLSRVHEHGR